MGATRTGMRAFTSISLLVTFVLLTASGLAMLLAPRGRPGGGPPGAASGFSFMHFVKETHEWVSLIFVVVALIHIAYNWRTLISYFGARRPQALT